MEAVTIASEYDVVKDMQNKIREKRDQYLELLEREIVQLGTSLLRIAEFSSVLEIIRETSPKIYNEKKDDITNILKNFAEHKAIVGNIFGDTCEKLGRCRDNFENLKKK